MITTDINRAEFTGNGSATDYVFASGGTNIPVKNQDHIKVYLTNTGTFTANASTEVFTNVTLNGSANINHGHVDTEIIRVSAATALPAGLIVNTDYYIREKTSTTFKVALTSGGDVVPITDTGTGALTWTKSRLNILGTDYTVVISGTTATVKFTVAPPNTVGILLLREVPFEQNTDLLNNSLIEAESLESQLDLIVNQTQQLKNQTARDLRLSDNLTASDATERAVTLNVTSANRASKALKFDAQGDLAVSDIDVDQSQDYTLEAQSWATQSPAAVNTYTDSVSTPVSPTAYSAKEHAVGDATPSSKNYATKVNGAVTGTDYSAKAWSVGGTGVTETGTRGSAKDWATKDDGVVDTAEFSAKAYASVTGSNAPTDGSAKEWATLATTPTTTAEDASAKEWATGVSTHKNEGSAKDWAIYTEGDVRGASTGSMSAKEWAVGTQGRGVAGRGSAKDWAIRAEDSVVDNAGYSALHWAAKAANSQIAAKNSAAAIANSFDSFNDIYLGSMSDAVAFTANSSTDFLTSTAHGLVDTQQIQVVGSDLPSGLSASTNYFVRDKTTNTFKLAATSGGTAINIVDNGSGSTWIYGDFATPTSSSWAKNGSTITVASNIGIRVGQVVSGTGIPAPTDSPARPKPNVLSIDGTAIVISENMAAAGSGVAVTFANKGVYGAFNTTKDGPSTDNDGDALADGMLYFNTTDNNMMVYKETGAAWIQTSASGGVSLVMHKATASGSETSLAASDFSPTLSYQANNIILFLNGVKLDATDYTASTGTTITGLSALAASDEVVVLAFKTFEVGDAVSAASGGTFNGNVSFADNNITNVGDIALDTITADGSSIIVNTDTALAAGVDLETSTTGKIKMKGSFMQSSTHQALVLGG